MNEPDLHCEIFCTHFALLLPLCFVCASASNASMQIQTVMSFIIKTPFRLFPQNRNDYDIKKKVKKL